MNILLVQPFIFPEAEILSKKNTAVYNTMHKYLKKLAFLDNYVHLQQLAAVTQKEHNITFIDQRFDEIDYESNYDVVGITCVTGYANKVYCIADEFRKRNKIVIIGGPHASALPEEAKQHADAVVVGEAEETWPQLLKDFENGKLNPFYRTLNHIDPKKIPSPRRSIIKKSFFPVARVQATRGCPFNCDFCAVKNIEGSKLRKRPIENIIDEIKTIPQKFIKFSDASLTIDTEYTKDLFREMKKINKKFTCFGNQNPLNSDEELLRLAKEAGCTAWYIGFESVSQKTVDRFGKKNKVDEYVETAKKIHKYGMAVSGSFIFGFDEDTKETANEIIKMMYEMKIDLAEINELTPFPGTPLYERLDREGRIINKDWFNYREGQPGTTTVFKPKNMTADELRKEANKMFRQWYTTRNHTSRVVKSMKYGFYHFLFTTMGPNLFA